MSMKIVLLDDAPAETDEFGVNAHDRIAKSIAELASNEDGARVIGLEGEWGSGKSTVVELIKARFVGSEPDGQKDRTLIVIDAWRIKGTSLGGPCWNPSSDSFRYKVGCQRNRRRRSETDFRGNSLAKTRAPRRLFPSKESPRL